MGKPYLLSPCVPDSLREILDTLPAAKRTVIEKELAEVDRNYTTGFAISELARLLPQVRCVLPVVPVLCPGILEIGIDQFFRSSVDDWMCEKHHFSHILVTGHHADPGSDLFLAPERLQSLLDLRVSGVTLASQVQSLNAVTNAQWIVAQVKRFGITAIAYRVQPSHSGRFFRTLLKALEREGLDRTVVLMPWLKTGNPYQVRPLTEPWDGYGHSDVQLYPGETCRCCNYAVMGDVATVQQVEDYFSWLFTDSPAAAALGQGKLK